MKNNKVEYMCMYVLGDGRTQQVSKVAESTNIADAMRKMANFMDGMCKKHKEDFDTDTVVSFTIMRKPAKRGTKRNTSKKSS